MAICRYFDQYNKSANKQQKFERLLQSGVGNAHEAHLLDAAAVELAHGAVLEGPLLGGALRRLRAVEQLVRVWMKYKRT